MAYTLISIPAGGGTVVLKVTCPSQPQNVSAVLWRYNADKSPDIRVGAFMGANPEIQAGSPADLKDKYLAIEGVVLPGNDRIPTPYDLEVSVYQGGVLLKNDRPQIGGTGSIGSVPAPFFHVSRWEVV